MVIRLECPTRALGLAIIGEQVIEINKGVKGRGGGEKEREEEKNGQGREAERERGRGGDVDVRRAWRTNAHCAANDGGNVACRSEGRKKKTRPMRIERLNSIRRRRSEEVLCARK